MNQNVRQFTVINSVGYPPPPPPPFTLTSNLKFSQPDQNSRSASESCWSGNTGTSRLIGMWKMQIPRNRNSKSSGNHSLSLMCLSALLIQNSRILLVISFLNYAGGTCNQSEQNHRRLADWFRECRSSQSPRGPHCPALNGAMSVSGV